MHALTFGKYAWEMMVWATVEIQEKVTRDIKKIIPRFPDEPIFCEVFRWPEAVCTSGPGHIASIQRVRAGLRSYRGLELAGAYLLMPSVEAAVASGISAARRILERS